MHEHLPHHKPESTEELLATPKISSQFEFQYVLSIAILVGALLVSGTIIYSTRNLANSLLSVSSAANGQQAMGNMQMGAQQNKPAQAAAGKKVTVDVGHLPAQGNPNAKVKIIAFEDFRCPFCEKFFTSTEPQIIKDYVDTGKAVLYFRQYQFLGAPSVVAGNAAECANEQNKFWDFHNYLYKNQPPESDTSLYTTVNMTKISGQLGLNAAKFSSCLSSSKFNKNVADDLAAGQAAGVTGTPTVFINDIPLVGAQPYAAFKAAIDQQLAN